MKINSSKALFFLSAIFFYSFIFQPHLSFANNPKIEEKTLTDSKTASSSIQDEQTVVPPSPQADNSSAQTDNQLEPVSQKGGIYKVGREFKEAGQEIKRLTKAFVGLFTGKKDSYTPPASPPTQDQQGLDRVGD